MPENATFPPTPAWTDHERMLVVYRIAGLMQRRAQTAVLPGNPRCLVPEELFDLGERIKFVVSMDRAFLEANRVALLRDLTPPDGVRGGG
jgi:hypothetical protein